MSDRHRRIVIGVTSDQSIRLITGFPGYLADRGWDVHVVSSPGPLLDEMSTVPGVRTHALPMAREPSPLQDLKSLIAWVRLLRQIRPGVMTVGTPKAGLVAGLAGWLVRVPSRVYHLRGLRLESVKGGRRLVFLILERVAVATAHRVLVVSPSLRDRAVELGVVRRAKTSVLGDGSSNGVDVDAFSAGAFDPLDVAAIEEQLRVPAGVPVIGFVGRLTEDKGLRVLGGAVEMLLGAKVDHQLLVVGGVEDDAAVRAMSASSIRAGGRPLIVTGHVRNPEIYYQLMTVLCLPTYREGFPNVVLEAAAASVPAVTTTATGAVDSVVDGVSGVIATVGSSRALADGLLQLLSDPTESRRMGERARARVVKSFSRSRVWDLTEKFFEEAEAQRGNIV